MGKSLITDDGEAIESETAEEVEVMGVLRTSSIAQTLMIYRSRKWLSKS